MHFVDELKRCISRISFVIRVRFYYGLIAGFILFSESVWVKSSETGFFESLLLPSAAGLQSAPLSELCHWDTGPALSQYFKLCQTNRTHTHTHTLGRPHLVNSLSWTGVLKESGRPVLSFPLCPYHLFPSQCSPRQPEPIIISACMCGGAGDALCVAAHWRQQCPAPLHTNACLPLIPFFSAPPPPPPHALISVFLSVPAPLAPQCQSRAHMTCRCD